MIFLNAINGAQVSLKGVWNSEHGEFKRSVKQKFRDESESKETDPHMRKKQHGQRCMKYCKWSHVEIKWSGKYNQGH